MIYYIIVLPTHIPQLLNVLKPVWAQWELLGQALNIPQHKLDSIKFMASNHQENLSKVVNVFGATTAVEMHTWRKIHEAVVMLGRQDIAGKITEHHSNLDEPCKSVCLTII